MTYWRLHYHLIWSTFQRQPSITAEREKLLFGVIYQKARELDLKIHAAGCTQDHVHLAVSIPPKLSISDTIKQLKGASAHALNHMDGSDGEFEWQEGYGALSIGERSLSSIMKYVSNQKEHHKNNGVNTVLERIQE